MKRNLRSFPVQVALAALVFYLFTLAHGVTANSLALTAKFTGWDWQPLVGHPVLWLLTLPVRILPLAWVPTALNLLSALLASLTLGVLARCLELMPWPRPLATLPVWQRRLPALLGLLVCGLELNFWQSATAATGHMLDVLLFALPVWGYLEFRRDIFKELRWLHFTAFAWGLATAENCLMIFALPVLAAALVALDPLLVVLRPAVRRLGLLALVGLAFYALTPLVNGLTPGSTWNLVEAARATLLHTKQELVPVFFQFFLYHRLMGLLVVLFFLLPVLACLVRLHDETITGKLPLDQGQIWGIRALRLVLLLVCLWLALDPVAGPRSVLQQQLRITQPLLGFDFLNGLGTAYLAGCLLLMRRRWPAGELPPFDPFEIKAFAWLEHLALPVVLALVLLTGGLLALRNQAPIRLTNRQPLAEFEQPALAALPAEGGIVLADGENRLWTFQAALATRPGTARNWLPVDFRSLPEPDYRERLARRHPGPWLLSTNRQELSSRELIQLLDQLVRSNRVFYLHPSFGPLFEGFYLQPAGVVYELKPFLTNAINPPALTPAQLADQAAAWDAAQARAESLLRSLSIRKPPLQWKAEKKLHLRPVIFEQGQLLREWYSLDLNAWGVTLQRAGQADAARPFLLQALELSPNNWMAQANLYCNTNLVAGTPMGLTGADRLASQLGNLNLFLSFLNQFGPVDDPALCFLLGNAYAREGLPRLALQQYERAGVLAPGVLAPQFALATLYLRCGLPTKAEAALAQLRQDIKPLPQAAALATEISFFEADLWLVRSNAPAARNVLLELARQHPDDSAIIGRIWPALARMGEISNALAVVEGQLGRRPNDLALLLTQSGLLLQTGRPEAALEPLDRLLQMTNYPPARLNRAIARLQLQRYAAARADFTALEESSITPFTIQFGLAESALGLGETNQAMEHFRQCLSNAPPGSAQWNTARARLDARR